MSLGPIRDSREFRDALGCFPTGVAVITAPDGEGGYVGVTANSFNSVSLDPPLVLWSLAKSAYSRDAFHRAGWFAINILASDQMDLSQRFATTGADKFVGVTFSKALGGVALLAGCAARFQCRTFAIYEGGDHEIFVGEVLDYDYSGRSPLVFHRGAYAQAVRHDEEAGRAS